MRLVLMIVYYFPPLGSVQVLRALKFAKYLPRFGWKPYILAVKEIHHYYYDPDLLKELPDDVEIIRTESWDPFRLVKRFSKNRSKPGQETEISKSDFFLKFRDSFNLFNRWISLPDSRFGWYPHAVKKGMEIIQNHPIDIIYSCSPPNINQLIGLKLSRQSGLPWVADFKDLWSDYPHQSPTPFHRRKMQNWENQIVRHATTIITVNPAITGDFQKRYPDLPEDKFKTIIHGFDTEEYRDIERRPNAKFTIVHTGSFFEPRQIPDYFFKALALLVQEKPDYRDKIQVQLIGTLTDRHRNLINQLNLNSIIQLIGSVNRKDAIHHQINGDLLLLLVGEGPHSELVLPAKTWEYLASGRPILSLIPAGVTSDLIRKHDLGIIVDPQDIEMIKKTIDIYYQKYSTDTLVSRPLAHYSQYDRKVLTGILADLLNQFSRSKTL